MREENLLAVPYGGNGKRLHFHGLPQKVTGWWGERMSVPHQQEHVLFNKGRNVIRRIYGNAQSRD